MKGRQVSMRPAALGRTLTALLSTVVILRGFNK